MHGFDGNRYDILINGGVPTKNYIAATSQSKVLSLVPNSSLDIGFYYMVRYAHFRILIFIHINENFKMWENSKKD